MSFFGFGQSAELELVLSDAESRRRVEHKTEEGKKEKYFLFYDGETVSGRVVLTLKNPNKRLEHQGIKVEFIGQIGERGGGPAAWRLVPCGGVERGKVGLPPPDIPCPAACPSGSASRRTEAGAFLWPSWRCRFAGTLERVPGTSPRPTVRESSPARSGLRSFLSSALPGGEFLRPSGVIPPFLQAGRPGPVSGLEP